MKKLLIGLGVVLIAGGSFFLYQSTQAKANEDTKYVELYKVEKQTPLHLKGQVQPTKKQTVLIAEDKGKVRTIHVNEGDHVLKETILVTYEWGEQIRAAYDSVVTSINEDAKNDPQQSLMVLKSEESAIKGTVTEYDKEKVALNEPIEIQCTNNDRIVTGRVTNIAEINNEPSDETTTSIVTYNFSAVPDETIPVGYSVELLIPRNELHLPIKSVVEKDGSYRVYSVKDGKAVEKSITAVKGNGYYILQSGINVDEKIVKDATNIKDGMDVTVQ
ncbi:efflux RND transporter periplasmic adaptor subunit [Candidatus Enterococcus ferrettii]|uniref:HlyD family secretion protein n=1 Tax=Candidatus Enterococcus ferrettii TaxID=2815324 RepID=A0ABV0EJ26_9ENTE|nr:efflux RND transporter periplasmic adaptor subunit [Enterococcus sp. 665A]MBO1339182.1 efflux RND transporter periplasmic adaptor subunit [Enterococcus sp. 665A]